MPYGYDNGGFDHEPPSNTLKGIALILGVMIGFFVLLRVSPEIAGVICLTILYVGLQFLGILGALLIVEWKAQEKPVTQKCKHVVEQVKTSVRRVVS